MNACIHCVYYTRSTPQPKRSEHQCTHPHLRHPVTDEPTCCHENRSAGRLCGEAGLRFESAGNVG